MGAIGVLRGAAAAVFAFMAISVAAPAPSAAASYTVNFTGVVTNLDAYFSGAGYAAGDAVSGSITFDPINTSSFTTSSAPFGGSNRFDQPAVTFGFHVAHAGGPTFSRSDSGTGAIASSILSAGSYYDDDTLSFSGVGAVSTLRLSYRTYNNTVLTSLAGLPANPTLNALMAFLGGTPQDATGSFVLTGLGSIAFDITAPLAQTPIPGALLLFASALGGLGLCARWRGEQTGARGAA